MQSILSGLTISMVDFMCFILFFSAAGAAVYLWVSLYRGVKEPIAFKE
jgi:hypothetical protein